MAAGPKDATQTGSKADDALAQDIAMTIELAAQACDGHQLSDEELDELCDAILADAGVDRKRLEAKTRKR